MVPDFAEVASLAAHTGGAPVDMVLPVVMRGTAIAGRSHTEQCRSRKALGCYRPITTGLPTIAEPEAIVVGAVRTGAPWFLTGWAEGTKVEFMIDTGCQVTILATSVFERMYAGNPHIWTRFRPCSWRLVSADSSPLSVRGELCMTIAFLGLQCDIMLVIASIGSEGLLGRKHCNHVCLISLIYVQDSGLMAGQHGYCISNVRRSGCRRIPKGY